MTEKTRINSGDNFDRGQREAFRGLFSPIVLFTVGPFLGALIESIITNGQTNGAVGAGAGFLLGGAVWSMTK